MFEPILAGVMDFEIVVRNTAKNVYAATSPDYPSCRGTGGTEEEAIRNLKIVVADWISINARPATKWVKDPITGKTGNPWLDTAGIFADDPTWDAFQSNIAEYRRQQDAEDAARWAAEDLAGEAITDKAA
jgi:predicted RNase H-like HicB family nuclease